MKRRTRREGESISARTQASAVVLVPGAMLMERRLLHKHVRSVRKGHMLPPARKRADNAEARHAEQAWHRASFEPRPPAVSS